MRFFRLLKQYFSLLCSKRASRYKLSGKCKKCGACCKNITFLIGENYIKTPEQFEKMKEWDKKYNHFFISGAKEDGTLLFTCKSLGKDNLCKDYRWRSLYCKAYPVYDTRILSGNFEMLEGCGFKIVPEKSFEEFLR